MTNPTTLHREGLSGTGLTVGEYANIVSINTALGKLGDLLKHFRLRAIRLKHLENYE